MAVHRGVPTIIDEPRCPPAITRRQEPRVGVRSRCGGGRPSVDAIVAADARLVLMEYSVFTVARAPRECCGHEPALCGIRCLPAGGERFADAPERVTAHAITALPVRRSCTSRPSTRAGRRPVAPDDQAHRTRRGSSRPRPGSRRHSPMRSPRGRPRAMVELDGAPSASCRSARPRPARLALTVNSAPPQHAQHRATSVGRPASERRWPARTTARDRNGHGPLGVRPRRNRQTARRIEADPSALNMDTSPGMAPRVVVDPPARLDPL